MRAQAPALLCHCLQYAHYHFSTYKFPLCTGTEQVLDGKKALQFRKPDFVLELLEYAILQGYISRFRESKKT